jgi:hypothetical protein
MSEMEGYLIRMAKGDQAGLVCSFHTSTSYYACQHVWHCLRSLFRARKIGGCAVREVFEEIVVRLVLFPEMEVVGTRNRSIRLVSLLK